MSNMEVASAIYVYELDDKEEETGKSYPQIVISSHWNRVEFIVIGIGKHTYTVTAKDLILAVENATNCERR